MALNKSKGNMYEFVTHTWNTVKGNCYHDCSYCYMKGINKRFKKDVQTWFDTKELKTNLGNGRVIFVGSSNDLFAENIPEEWIVKTLKYCNKFANAYVFNTKNPIRAYHFSHLLPSSSTIIATVETNRYVPEVMGKSPKPLDRINAISSIGYQGFATMITIEPIMDFDLEIFSELLKKAEPNQINIGAATNSKNWLAETNFPEPPKWKIQALINELQKYTTVHLKSNMKSFLQQD